MAGWASFKSRWQASKKAGKFRGLGMSTYIEACADGPKEAASVKLEKDGTATVLIGTQTLKALQEAVVRGDESHVAGDRFDEHGGDLPPMPRERFLDRRQIVVPREDRIGGGCGRHAGAGRDAECHRARSGLHEERVGMPVIAALELDDLVPLPRRACSSSASCRHPNYPRGAHRSYR